jgi:ribosomal protein S18 acetylase RimI-like enzyme
MSSDLALPFQLSRFSHVSDRGFSEAMAVYEAGIGPNILTDPRQIAYWQERGYAAFGDENMNFGIWLEGRIVGYAMLTYFRKEKFLYFDYIVLDKSCRGGNGASVVTALLKRLQNDGYAWDFLAGEVDDEDGQSARLLRFYKNLGFLVVPCRFYIPSHGPSRGIEESATPAHFLIKADRLPSPDTVGWLVDILFEKHYLRWYTPFLDDIDAYRQHLDLIRQNLFTAQGSP